MTETGLIVRAPAGSANLGPGFDMLAAALEVHLELEVTPGPFSVSVEGDPVPEDGTNLCVRAFEMLAPADGCSFSIRSDIPVGRGLGSSGAAIAAGLVAADRMHDMGTSLPDLVRLGAELEGHADNVAASLMGGLVVCVAGSNPGAFHAISIDLPSALEAVLVIPAEALPTVEARAALPAEVPLADAVFNASHVAGLMDALHRADWDLMAISLADRLHQPYRSHLYPQSMALVEEARKLGAIGATISGAGPTVLLWALHGETDQMVKSLAPKVSEWATIRATRFASRGASVKTVERSRHK